MKLERSLIMNESEKVKLNHAVKNFLKSLADKNISLMGWAAILFGVLAVIFSIYHLIVSGFYPIMSIKHRAIHVMGALVLVFMIFPLIKKRKEKKKSIPLIDWLLIIAALYCGVYTVTMIDVIAERGGYYTTLDTITGGILLLLILEAARRTIGNILVILSLIFVAYSLFGQYLPGLLRHAGFSPSRLIDHLYLTTEGVFGITTGVSSTYVFLFVLFGAVLARSGLADFFNKFAIAIAGRRDGGPAKVAVLGSGLLGSINGSAASNVATTGAFTIPLMKRVGYSPQFAGAVEASASTGGQILPPVMGAGAFLMAEFLAIPYITIAYAAIVPALLYYFSVWVAIDLRAKKYGLKKLDKKDIPNLKEAIIKQGHLAIPIIFIVILLMNGFTPLYAASRAILLSIVISFIRKSTWLTPRKLWESFVDGARLSLSVAIACITVGYIVGIISLTGLGTRLGSAILSISSETLWITLILVMLVSIIMGMGLPTSAAYIVAIAVAGPALITLGVEPLTAHLFVFYFAMLAGITPPVAITAFVGAAIAEAPPNKTSFLSLRLALIGFIVPFIFVYSPSLLMIEGSISDKVIILITSIIGVISLAAGFERYLLTDMSILMSILSIATAIILLIPNIYSDIAGVILITFIVIFQRLKKVKENSPKKSEIIEGA
jgi:TRAP transporter 4TM/12TM fusion protein